MDGEISGMEKAVRGCHWRLDVLDEDFACMETLIASSIAYQNVVDVRPAGMSLAKLDSCFSRALPDYSLEGGERLLRLLSQLFVRSIAVVEPREGMLHAVPARRTEALAALAQILKPGDFLLEKPGFRLTNRFVPGYWGRLGIWLGTGEELETLGVWNDPRLQKIRAADRESLRRMAREGRGVIEALLVGGDLNTLEHFINVDGLAVVRPRLNDDPQRVSTSRRYAYGSIPRRRQLSITV